MKTEYNEETRRLIIEVPIDEEGFESSTRKMMFNYWSGGWRKTDLKICGREIKINLMIGSKVKKA